MNHFVQELTTRLSHLSNDFGLAELYEWMWDHQADIHESAIQINMTLGLTGDFALQPDLPCLSIGSRNGLLVLAANPGWKPMLNAREDSYCRRSKEAYKDVMFNFFSVHPRVVGERVRWWSKPMSFVQLLRNGSSRFGKYSSASQRWLCAHQSGLIGGWELFPWHSTSDGISAHIGSQEWLARLIRESVNAAVRFAPEVLLVASKAGFDLIRHQMLPDASWIDSEIGTRTPTKVSYLRCTGGTDIVAIARQIFSAQRDFKNDDLFATIDSMRGSQPQMRSN